MSRGGSRGRSRPDTPETDDDTYSHSVSSSAGSSGGSYAPSDATRKRSLLRRMWPRIVQTNDAAILKARTMAKTHSTIGKDLSDVQSSLWQNRAVKIMTSTDHQLLGAAVAGGGVIEKRHSSRAGAHDDGVVNESIVGSGIGNLPMSPLQKQLGPSKSSSKMSSTMMNSSVRREVFVDLEALNRPMSADVSGTGTNLPIMSMRRRFVKFSSSGSGSGGNRDSNRLLGSSNDLGSEFARGDGEKLYEVGHNLFDNAHHAGYHHSAT